MSEVEAQDHVVEVEDETNWLVEIKRDLGNLSPFQSSNNWTICRVPGKIRAQNEEGYNPQIISIGPFHHHEDNLLDMEPYKARYLLSFLHRTPQPERTLEEYGKVILSLDQKVRASYAEPIDAVDTALAKMMLYDGCFILEFFIRNYMSSGEKQNDPIFSTYWMIPSLQHDLALLENQIPFFVLEQLLETTKNLLPAVYHQSTVSLPSVPLTELALYFFKPVLSINQWRTTEIRGRLFHHLLHLIHTCLLPSSPTVEAKEKSRWRRCIDVIIPSYFLSSSSTNSKGAGVTIPCAIELAQAGVEFKKDTAKNLFDVSFKNGTFKIPPLFVHDLTDSLFRNLIAFEQCIPDNGQYMTSYASIMDSLVNGPEDVELLERQGVIENYLSGDSNDAADLFNNICRQVVVQDWYYEGLCKEVNAYCNTKWNRYRASLQRDYFNNPWSTISFTAALVLLILTTLQTVYALLAYYNS